MLCPIPLLHSGRSQDDLPTKLSVVLGGHQRVTWGALCSTHISVPGLLLAPLLNKLIVFSALVSLPWFPTLQTCQKVLPNSSELNSISIKFLSTSECDLIWK